MNKHSIGGEKPLNNLKHYLKIMRITLFFLFFSILFTSASNSYSQVFTLKSRTASIKEVCREIEKESDFIFVFSDNCENLIDEKINIDANAKNVTEILDVILSETGLKYRVLDKQIVIYASGQIMPAKVTEHKIPVDIIQQPPKKQVTGRVIDAQGVPVIGANIIESGTTNGTISDIDGNFSISVEEDATVHVSYFGYLSLVINTSG